LGWYYIRWRIFFIDDVSIVKAQPFVEIPNVFTPNSDGINDFISPKVHNASRWEMNIINRWGDKIITLNEDYSVWNGGDANCGIYYYHLTVEGKSIAQGFISLIRD
jgi:gliding motility-associated-like protein